MNNYLNSISRSELINNIDNIYNISENKDYFEDFNFIRFLSEIEKELIKYDSNNKVE